MDVTESVKRIAIIDLLRGFAVLGTLGTNIWIFAHFGDVSLITTADYNGWWSLNDFLRMVVLFLVNGKLLGLLTIMFGVGLELKYQQAKRKGNAWPGMYLWILLFLFLEGFIHFTLVMEYDILMSYAVTGVIVSYLLKAGDHVMKWALYGLSGLHGGIILLLLASALLGANISTASMDWLGALYQNGTWFEQIYNRLLNFAYFRTEAIFIIPMNVCLFLIGIKLMRSGVFAQDETGRHLRKKLLIYGMGFGIPLNLLIFVPGGAFDLPVRYLFAPIMSLGYIGLFGILVVLSKLNWLWNRLEEVGKMSLSCYVLQNILASFLFYRWGLGLGGQLNSLQIIGIWALISGIQLIFAYSCINSIQTGPLEWTRRRLIQIITPK